MDRLNAMAVFVAVAEEESFAAGARRLGMSPPTVTRTLSMLEEYLGAKLLHRTTRHVRLTDAGRRYLEDSRRILAEIDEADETAAGIHSEPRGHLVITAPVLFGKMFVTPAIVAFLEKYPKMKISALFLDRVANLMEEGIDVGIRIGELADSSMNALRVGTVRQVLCAAPSYLDHRGRPATPEDMNNHCIIAATGISPSIEWKFRREETPFNIRIKPRLTVTSNDAAIEATVAGFGITRLMSYQIAPQLASGQLKILLSEFELNPIPIHIIHQEGRRTSAKVRAFIDLIAEHLRANDALN